MQLVADISHDWRQYAFVVVGSGFAGLYLAEKLARFGKVLVIEAGPADRPLEQGRGYYEIESTGWQFPSLGERLRSFGGTSNHWTGQSRPFAPAIFDNRPSLGIAGWPIPYSEYAHYLPDAKRWLNLGESFEPVASSLDTGLLSGLAGMKTFRFHHAHPMPHLGMTGTRERFLESSGIDVLTDTRVTDLHLGENGNLAALELKPRASSSFRIPAATAILCTGGIENARLLLYAGRKYAAGNPLLGGPSELTGRYFAEHPVHFPIELFVDDRIDLTDALTGVRNGMNQQFLWSVEDRLLDEHELLRFAVSFQDEGSPVGPAESEAIRGRYLTSSAQFRSTLPAFRFEQSPYADSRVTLSDRLDADGLPLARLNWAIAPSDFDRYRRAVLLFCSLAGQTGYIHARLRAEYRVEDWSGILPGRSAHHMGTTSMAHAANAGVVDTDCRVFGLSNLYVAGASVFPNGDFLNPTLNLLALAGRLAEHLVRPLRSRRETFRFSSNDHSNHLGEGWSHSEPTGTWTDGERATISIPRPGTANLRLRGSAYRMAPVKVTVNGRTIYDGPGQLVGSLRHEPERSFTFPPGDSVEITFSFDKPRSPFDSGESDDRRKLGYFLEWIELW